MSKLQGWLQDVSEKAEALRLAIENGEVEDYDGDGYVVADLNALYLALDEYMADFVIGTSRERDPGPSQEQRL